MAMLFTPVLFERAERILARCRGKRIKLATAESCTGGLVAALLTEVPGSSDVIERGFVAYANDAKVELLGVRRESLEREGAVSELVAREMAQGALNNGKADLAIAVTGIAGPAGGTAAKPVGLIHLAAALKDGRTLHEAHRFPGDRSAVRKASLEAALGMLERSIESEQPKAVV